MLQLLGTQLSIGEQVQMAPTVKMREQVELKLAVPREGFDPLGPPILARETRDEAFARMFPI
jgi:hypothetical protein